LGGRPVLTDGRGNITEGGGIRQGVSGATRFDVSPELGIPYLKA